MEQKFISFVEPFVDLDIAAVRAKYVDQALVEQAKLLVKGRLGNPGDDGFVDSLASVLGEIVADLHAVKAAYLDQCRYRDPGFSADIPSGPVSLERHSVEVDLRTDITGGNWWGAEPDGRWAGPESESSLFLPSLKSGWFNFEIEVVDEIEPGLLDEVKFSLDQKEIALVRRNAGFPTVMETRVEVPVGHRLPFHVVKFNLPCLRSPSESGVDDTRRLSIRVQKVTLRRVG